MQPYDMSNSYIQFSTAVCRQSDTVCQLGCSVSFVYERVRCNGDSSKTGNMCGERIYVVPRGVHTTNLFS